MLTTLVNYFSTSKVQPYFESRSQLDSLTARSDRSDKRRYDRAIAKVQALSNAVNRSPKMNDNVEEITGTTFINPTSTR